MQTTTPAFTVSVINAGTGPLTITNVSVSNAQFAQTNACTTLATGANCTVTLTFTPSVQGAVNGNLVVTTSAGLLTVPLTGVGERSLVIHYYQAILNRAPDAAGKAFWEGEATRMAGLGADLREAYFVMANYFFNSPEYQSYGKNDTQFVTDLYNTFFNRPPDSGGLAYWLSQIAGGMPRDVVLFSFMFSTEFNTFTTGIFGNTAARPEVNMVMDFFRGVLNRLPDTAAYNFWVGQLKTAQCQSPGAVYAAVNSISYAFIFGTEYSGRARNNTQFVTDMYNSFLRRGGD
ncbi:MAG TPA: DUF4214 domain-containing protein, partial [Ktedonobacterales bacterium]|nr:DUF4214 domain-containing protein [Ktedonobacterales bacterium]